MFYKINGRAGHGKTTRLVNDIQDMYDPELEIWQQPFILITPTNKAAMVLNSRLEAVGLPHLARTLHSTLYVWTPTTKIKTTRRVRFIDSNTGKFAVDQDGNPVYQTETEYYMQKRVKNSIKNKIVFVDESSMVGSDVWYDLINCGLINEIHAYGDERQLPPIEKLEDLDPQYQPYYRFWHNYNVPQCITTLTVNHRQAGTLKEIVETIETSLFSGKYGADIPSNLMYGDNFTVHCTDLSEADLLHEMMAADIIITPYNKVRQLANHICRRAIAQATKNTFNPLPVIGDKFIFVDAIKTEEIINGQPIKQIYLPKNVTATIQAINDISIVDNLMNIDFIDEMGTLHQHITVSLNTIMGVTTNTGAPRIDYAYAVTVHSSQGGGWKNVLFLNGHWPGEDSTKLRYVGITRAQERLAVINGITNSTESKDADRSIVIRLGKMLGWK